MRTYVQPHYAVLPLDDVSEDHLRAARCVRFSRMASAHRNGSEIVFIKFRYPVPDELVDLEVLTHKQATKLAEDNDKHADKVARRASREAKLLAKEAARQLGAPS